ncbi:MAG: hypothetical protein JSS83_24830 [Cyanobacteria bacterium SZAS LIN-3]|nr:hypothetical protein [Cyanobacteria bacterium SZAS LIN-3]
MSKQIVPPDAYGIEPANGTDSRESGSTGNGNSTEDHDSLPSTTYSQAPVPVLPIETVSKDNRSSKGKSSDAVIPENVPFGNNPIAGYGGSTSSGSGGGSGSLASSLPSPKKEFKPEAFSLDALKGADDKVSDEPSEKKSSSSAAAAIKVPDTPPAPVAAANPNNEQILEVLTSIDTQLGIYSVNMAQLAKATNEQLEVVRNLAEVVQNQAFSEIGLSLSSLSESMSAALEPMKAVGELVPAIDNLVTTIERGQQPKDDSAKLTPDELVMSLANQLSNQAIDPWTFKCAYMAVFPSEHPADLLRKLVDLLGTQTLSGDLFRAAYDAVQAPDPPKPEYYSRPPQQMQGEEGTVREIVKVVQDEAVLAQIEELRQFNEELRGRMDQRENEYAEMLAAKDSEVQESQQNQQALNARFEEFNARYEEVSELVRQRNDLIQQKDTELQQKDEQLQILRAQLDEMRDHTKDVMADLQKQLTTMQQAAEEAAKAKAAQPLTKAQTNFFEATSTPAPQAPQNQSLFSEPAPQANLSGQPLGLNNPQAPQLPLNSTPAAAPAPAQMPAPPAPTTTQAELAPVDPAGLAANLANNPGISNQAIPRPQVSAPTTPMMGSGSYGSGVRAQVFEVIVRQALAGAPWREICAGPMQVNNISPDEVEAEVKRRQELLKK